MCRQNAVNESDGLAGKIKKKNFKTRRRLSAMGFKFGTVLFFVTLALTFNYIVCEIENDVLTLQDDLEEASDRRRPSNDQEKDILRLDALGRRKGSYHHNSYSSSQEDDSIMDLLGKSEY